MSKKVNKIILIKENSFQQDQKVEYREYEWDNNDRIIIHESITENIPKEKLINMHRKMIFSLYNQIYDLNKDISIGLMIMGDLNPEEEAQKKVDEEKEAKRLALQEKINKRMRDKKR